MNTLFDPACRTLGDQLTCRDSIHLLQETPPLSETVDLDPVAVLTSRVREAYVEGKITNEQAVRYNACLQSFQRYVIESRTLRPTSNRGCPDRCPFC